MTIKYCNECKLSADGAMCNKNGLNELMCLKSVGHYLIDRTHLLTCEKMRKGTINVSNRDFKTCGPEAKFYEPKFIDIPKVLRKGDD